MQRKRGSWDKGKGFPVNPELFQGKLIMEDKKHGTES
jgi:hypothetical protein